MDTQNYYDCLHAASESLKILGVKLDFDPLREMMIKETCPDKEESKLEYHEMVHARNKGVQLFEATVMIQNADLVRFKDLRRDLADSHDTDKKNHQCPRSNAEAMAHMQTYQQDEVEEEYDEDEPNTQALDTIDETASTKTVTKSDENGTMFAQQAQQQQDARNPSW